jgi:hypothetical protein
MHASLMALPAGDCHIYRVDARRSRGCRQVRPSDLEPFNVACDRRKRPALEDGEERLASEQGEGAQAPAQLVRPRIHTGTKLVVTVWVWCSLCGVACVDGTVRSAGCGRPSKPDGSAAALLRCAGECLCGAASLMAAPRALRVAAAVTQETAPRRHWCASGA